MKKFKTVAECFKALKLDIKKDLPDVSKLPESFQKAVTSHFKIMVVIQAHCDGWQPDWSNYGQGKYYPWFDIDATKEKPSGSGLSYGVYVHSSTGTGVGSRLCLPSREQAKHVGVTFIKLYQEYMLFNQ